MIFDRLNHFALIDEMGILDQIDCFDGHLKKDRISLYGYKNFYAALKFICSGPDIAYLKDMQEHV